VFYASESIPRKAENVILKAKIGCLESKVKK